MGNPSHTRSTRRLVFLVWLLVAIFYFYLSYDYIRVSTSDKTLAEYLGHVVQLAAEENRPAKDIRALILVKAEELELPLRGEQIEILGTGQTLGVKVNYDADIEFPMIDRVLFKKQFHHDYKYHPPR